MSETEWAQSQEADVRQGQSGRIHWIKRLRPLPSRKIGQLSISGSIQAERSGAQPCSTVVLCSKAKWLGKEENKAIYSAADCIKAKNQEGNIPSLWELIRRADRLYKVDLEDSCSGMAALLKQLRQARGISQLQLADHAGVNASVVNRAERGEDAKLSTWRKLFEGLGYRLLIETVELSEEAGDLLTEEGDRRREKRRDGLCAGKRRF